MGFRFAWCERALTYPPQVLDNGVGSGSIDGYVGFHCNPLLYVAILGFTIITSGFAGGLGIGLVRMRGILTERVHVTLAILAIAIEVLAFAGLPQVDFVLRVASLIGIVLLSSGEHIRGVLASMIGEASSLMIFFMLDASTLLLPTLLPGFTLLLDIATVIGVLVGLCLNYMFFPQIV